MKILVTGVAGLIGSTFAKFLLREGEHEVLGVDDLSCGLSSNVPTGLPFWNISIGKDPLDDLFSFEKPDVVYHFAAYAAECLSPFIRHYNYMNNVVATADVVTACIKHNVQRLVFTSSMAVYGDGDPPFTESDDCHPIDPYGVAKFACEQDIKIAGTQHDLDWCILRPHNVYGPGQVCNQKFRNVFGIWMNKIKVGEPLLVYGDGSQTRAFSYVDDIMIPMYLAGVSPQASKQVINIGGSAPTSILTAAQVLTEVAGSGKIEFAEARHEVHQAWCTVAKSKDLLGYRDIVTLRMGLEWMWQWFITHEQEESGYPVFELEDGLPSYWRK